MCIRDRRETHGSIRVGVTPGRQTGPTGRALRRGCISIEARAFSSQARERWGLYSRHAIRLDKTTGIVRRDDHDVW